MNTTRREFVKQAGVCVAGAAAATAPVSAYGAARQPSSRQSTPTVIAVYLRGGADALATIVPYGDKQLGEVRSSLLIPGPKSTNSNRLLPLDDMFGFNPNMRELYALYQAGLCAPIVCVGSPHGTRSHFDAQDFMERGAPGQPFVSTGWLNRYLEETRTAKDANLRAISLQPLLPRSLRGEYPVLAKPEQKAELAMNVYYQLYGGMKKAPRSEAFGQKAKASIQEFGARTIEQLAELNLILEKSPPPAVKYPESGYGRQLRDIAKVIKANRGLEATAIDIGGWDHHINEGPLDGDLGRKLADVSGSVGAFVADLGPKLMENVLVLVMSEFGRTVHENGNKGTDHGHGGFMLAIGGRVNGKKVYGKWTGLAKHALYEQRDLPVNNDFRTVFAETLHKMFKFDALKQGLFPQYSADSEPLGFLHA
jgi:uncharacterized protein (DUF1501 family)